MSHIPTVSGPRPLPRTLRRQLESFACDPKRFPGGEHPTAVCTHCARLVVDRFGGEVRGYWHTENPTATAGQVEGGHDFALLSGHVIVDPWIYHYYGERPVLDLTIPEEKGIAEERYGPRSLWHVVEPTNSRVR